METLKKLDIGLTEDQALSLASAMEQSGEITLPNMEKVLRMDDKAACKAACK